jgi:hypothetical protein
LNGTTRKLLTVRTTKIRPSKPRVREEYTTSFMHIFGTNKIPRVVLWFSWVCAHFGRNWNQRATRARHGRPCRCGRPCQVRPHLPHGSCLVQSTFSPADTTYMNEIDQGNIGLIEWMRLGSLGSIGPLVRPINRHNHYSKEILSIPEWRWFITRHGVGPAAPRGRVHLPTVIAGETDPQLPQEQWSETSKARGSGSQGLSHPLIWTHLWYWAHALNRPPLPIKSTSHSLDWTHSAGASPFPTSVHLE